MSLGWEGSGARSSIFLGRAVFHLGYKYPSPPHFIFIPLDLTPSLELSKPSAAATSIVTGEEELHCLNLVTVVLVPAADFLTLPPP